MAVTGAARKDQNLNLSDDDTEALFASPLRPERPKDGKSMPEHHHTEHQSRKVEDREISGKEAREAALRKELAGIRNINQVIEGAIDGLERAGENMDVGFE